LIELVEYLGIVPEVADRTTATCIHRCDCFIDFDIVLWLPTKVAMGNSFVIRLHAHEVWSGLRRRAAEHAFFGDDYEVVCHCGSQ